MSKYDPLLSYLKRQTLSELILGFDEIEKILGASLPKWSETPQFWANVKGVGSQHVQRKAWRDAGYEAFLIAGSGKVRFRKPA